MEPAAVAGDVFVIPSEFGWNDVGSWDMMSVLNNTDANGNIVHGDHLMIDTTNSILHSSGRLISTMGIDSLIIVETPDAIMVCHKDKAQDVKLVVDALNEQKRVELL